MTPPSDAQIDLYQFADFSKFWLWYADGIGVDFTGCTATFALRVTPSDAAPFLACSTTPSAAGSAIVLGTAGASTQGLVTVNLNHVDIAAACAAAAATSVIPPVVHGDLLITMTNGQVIEFLHIDARVHQGDTY